MKSGEEKAVCGLVKQVFDEYVAPEYEKGGIEEFYRFANSHAMKERMKSGGFVIVAQQSDRLVGMVEFCPPATIGMLFVSVKRKGIASKLLEMTVTKVLENYWDVENISVHSSPYAKAIYQRLGFEIMGETTTENGITYIPMELPLEERNA